MKIKLSIVIVNYNGKKYLKPCIESIHNNCLGLLYEIIVVDNASTDGSIKYLKKEFPEVVLLENYENIGFGKANNLGVQASKYDTILLLNNDTILIDKLSNKLLNLLNQDIVGCVGVKMLDSKKNYLVATGYFPSFCRLVKLSFLNKNLKNEKNTVGVDWVSGSFMLLKKNIFNKIKGFDSDYFMYVEDVDLCMKIHKLGLQCLYFPDVKYIHFVGYDQSRDDLILNGFKRFVKKHYKGAKMYLCLFAIQLNILFKKIILIVK
ncbi:MAG: glycosyltransferase family 2 protein [Flavobacteriales bacterium]|nr:glycosyltransferase family 2 protein [Flavobacteriales bacterium]